METAVTPHVARAILGVVVDPVQIRIHAFKVNVLAGTDDAEQVLRRLKREALEDRLRLIAGEDMRAEVIKWVTYRQESMCFLDFVRIRDETGPGRVSRALAVAGFDLGEDEYFGEETAAIYVPRTNFMLLQYNHHGVKAPHIEDYLSACSNNATTFDLAVRLDLNAERRALAAPIVRRIEIGMDISQMTAADRAAGRSLGEMARLANQQGGARMEVAISVGRQPRRALGGGLMTDLLNLIQQNGNNPNTDKFMTKAHAVVQRDGGKPEAIDLLHHKLVHIDQVVPGTDRRLPHADRLMALKRALDTWPALLR